MNEQFMKERPIVPLILSIATPMAVSMLVNSLYNIVDSYFVAKISEDAMTAVSLVFPVQNFINALAIGFGVGINAAISFHLGEGDERSANTAATHGAVFSLLHSAVMTVVSIAIIQAFLRAFSNIEVVVSLGVRYSNIVFLFSVSLIMGIVFEKIFQSVGRMKVTVIGIMCGSITNIILDPLLIFGIGPFPALHIEGAALATGIGQTFTLIFYIIIYKLRPVPIKIAREYLAPNGAIDRRLYAVGIPATLNTALPSLLISCLNGLLAQYAQSYVVVLGIYYKLQTFLYLPINGIVQAIRPIAGYNYGAKKHKRVKSIFFVTICMSNVIMTLGTVICFSAPQQIIGLFSDNLETITAGKAALRIISAGFLFSSVSVTTSGMLEGLGKGKQSLIISLCRYVVVIIPVAFIFCHFWGPTGVWNSFWVTEMVSAGISALIWIRVSHSCLQTEL